MKILLGDFTAKLGREDIFRPTIANESLHEISNDNRVSRGSTVGIGTDYGMDDRGVGVRVLVV
jgi:hypothetical protein